MTISTTAEYTPAELDGGEIAVVGIACRFPGSNDARTYWRQLRDGVCSVRTLDDDALRAAGISEGRLAEPSYVKAAAFLDEPEAFDAGFFAMSPREAEITDPQHRVLLELAQHVLDDAGHTPEGFPGRIGVFAGATLNSYLVMNLAQHPTALADLEPVQLNIGNGGDFLTTRIAYKLNLTGPCYTVQSACSTSLVAVHAACESLLSEEADMALAGGVSINVGFRHGYDYADGGMMSPDGVCRPFDARAQGTLFGSGAGLVALRRLDDALADGDHIYAVVRGTAINNDGSLKVGYTAPSVDGQARVVREALDAAGLTADEIGYVEAHGTATPLGDPIEVQALSKAWRPDTDRRGFCALGSVKGNLGHLDAAAGIAGFIKSVLA
ncbi:MAG: polyketide synthase, partial [Acidobacteriota bacterium]